LIFCLVEISFPVEIVEFVLEINLGHVNAPLIALFQVVTQFLDKSFDTTATISGKLHAKVQGDFPQ
jgi:hypothetical protein